MHVCERGGLKLDLPNEGERNGMWRSVKGGGYNGLKNRLLFLVYIICIP